jgi:hypothetical protein
LFLRDVGLLACGGAEFNGAEYVFGLALQSVMGSLKWQCSMWFVQGWCVGVLFCTSWLRWECASGSWEASIVPMLRKRPKG